MNRIQGFIVDNKRPIVGRPIKASFVDVGDHGETYRCKVCTSNVSEVKKIAESNLYFIRTEKDKRYVLMNKREPDGFIQVGLWSRYEPKKGEYWNTHVMGVSDGYIYASHEEIDVQWVTPYGDDIANNATIVAGTKEIILYLDIY